MRVGDAREAAREWVRRFARAEPGYIGAYFTGSTVGMPDAAELAPSSDVDVALVTSDQPPSVKPGKLLHHGALLEISYVPWSELADPVRVLASYHLAGSFRRDTVIDDPTGRLRTLLAFVAPRFASTPWVRRRCEDACLRVETRLAAIDTAAPFHEQLLAWLFPTGVTCHVLLVAALHNPTVRLRYRAVRDVLVEYGHQAAYEGLLALLVGRVEPTRDAVQEHLDELTVTFDAAAGVARTPFPFSSDITPEARPIAVDGSQALIDAGDHREAVFWILATVARCHSILAVDAPALHAARTPAFRAAAADLAGIRTARDLHQRAAAVSRHLPQLRRTAEAVMAARAALEAHRGRDIEAASSPDR